MTAYELLTRIANGTAPKRIRIIDIDRDFMLGEDGHYYGGQKNMMNLNQILGSNLSIDEILTKFRRKAPCFSYGDIRRLLYC